MIGIYWIRSVASSALCSVMASTKFFQIHIIGGLTLLIINHHNHSRLYVFLSYRDRFHIFSHDDFHSFHTSFNASSIPSLSSFHNAVSSSSSFNQSCRSHIATQNIARNADTHINHAHATTAHPAHHPLFLYTCLVHCTNKSILLIVNDCNA